MVTTLWPRFWPALYKDVGIGEYDCQREERAVHCGAVCSGRSLLSTLFLLQVVVRDECIGGRQ